jgi:tape measure domain-containing protein
MADPTITVKVDTRAAERSLDNLTRAFTALGAVVVGASILDFVDQVTDLQNKLRNVTNSTEEFAAAQKAVFDIAKSTAAPVGEVAALYQRLSISQDEVGLTGAGVAKVTELISKQMKSAGVSGAQAASYILQLSQAFGAGKLSGDEFRSVMEANPAVMKMVAKEMGVTVGELKRLGSEGKITSQIMRDVFLKNETQIIEDFNKRTKSISDSFELLKTRAKEMFINFNDATGAVSAIATALEGLANNLGKVALTAGTFLAVLAVRRILAVAGAVGTLKNAFLALNAAMKANLIAAIISGLVFIGATIYDEVIAPLRQAGITSGLVGKLIAENLINAFLQVAEAAISIMPAIGKLTLDALTPGKKISDSVKEIDDIYAKILTTKRITLLNDKERAKIEEAMVKNSKKIADNGKLTKDTKVLETDEAVKALRTLDQTIRKLESAAKADVTRLQYGERYAKTQQIIAQEQDKLDLVGKKLTANDKLRIENAVKMEFYAKDMLKTQQTLSSLADQITINSEQDVLQREIKQALLQYERSVSKEIYNANKENLISLVKQNQEIQKANTLRREQADTINGLLRNQTALTTELGKMEEIKLQFSGMTREEIDAQRRAAAMAADPGGEKAMTNQRKIIQNTINAEVGKYDALFTLETEYQQNVAKLMNIQQLHEAGVINLSLKQQQALTNSRMMLAQNYANQEMELQSQIFQNYSKYQDLRIQRDAEAHAAALRNQRTLLGGQMFNEETIKQIAQERANFQKKTDMERTQFGIQQGAELFSALGSQNKKAFEAAKAFNIANAIMNTYMAATKALATYPWPFGMIAAAAAVATGFAQVNAIRSQQYSGRALGGPVMGGQPYMVGESGPELFTPNTTGSITRNNQLGGDPVTVNFTIQANDAQGFDDLLIQRRGMITQMISDAMLERGNRSMI